MLEAIGYDSPAGVYVFLFLTVLLGGGAAWRTGHAVAEQWGSPWPLVAFSALLALAVRFLHYALFGAPLISATSYVIDFIILITVAALGYRVRRTKQMTNQYPWAFARSSPFSWRAKT